MGVSSFGRAASVPNSRSVRCLSVTCLSMSTCTFNTALDLHTTVQGLVDWLDIPSLGLSLTDAKAATVALSA